MIAPAAATGVFSYASRTEPLFAGLEYLPVILAVLLFVIFPLHKLLPAPKIATTARYNDAEGADMQTRPSEATLVRPGSRSKEMK